MSSKPEPHEERERHIHVRAHAVRKSLEVRADAASMAAWNTRLGKYYLVEEDAGAAAPHCLVAWASAVERSLGEIK